MEETQVYIIEEHVHCSGITFPRTEITDVFFDYSKAVIRLKFLSCKIEETNKRNSYDNRIEYRLFVKNVKDS